MTDGTRRSLGQGEQFVLAQIQDIYGPQNEESDVFFSDQDEAAIFVKDRTGVTVGVVAVNVGSVAASAERDCALAAPIEHRRAAPQLHRWRA
jgi:hypothetical protein